MNTNNETVIAWCQLQQTRELLAVKQMRMANPYSKEQAYQKELDMIDRLLGELTAELTKE